MEGKYDRVGNPQEYYYLHIVPLIVVTVFLVKASNHQLDFIKSAHFSKYIYLFFNFLKNLMNDAFGDVIISLNVDSIDPIWVYKHIFHVLAYL